MNQQKAENFVKNLFHDIWEGNNLDKFITTLPSTSTAKHRLGCRLRVKILGKSGVYMSINEHFSRDFYTQDVPNMGFC